MTTREKVGHTPGPWEADTPETMFADYSFGVYADNAEPGERMPALATPCRSAEANARLIAAAPDLLEAVEMGAAERAVAAGLGASEWRAFLTDRERAAIAKAEGSAAP